MSGKQDAPNESARDREMRSCLTLPAHAKVNLRLRVLGRMEDGYHSVESLYLRLDLHDDVEVSSGDGSLRLEVVGDPSIPADESNLAWRAAEALFAEIGKESAAAIRLVKRIPAGAGLGGGSADAAAVLSGLNELRDRPLDDQALLRLAGELGSDVPFALSGAALALGWERGRRLLPLTPPPSRPVLVLVPDFRVPTAEAYAWLAAARADGEIERSNGLSMVLPSPVRLDNWEALAGIAVNDFESPVFARYPDLETFRTALLEAGAGIAILCGSGSSLMAVFEREEQRNAAAAELPVADGWREILTRTASSPPDSTA